MSFAYGETKGLLELIIVKVKRIINPDNKAFGLQIRKSWVYYPAANYTNFELTDHLGNVRVIMNENGEREAYTDYYPFGLAMSPNEISADNYRHGYQGQYAEKDEETGYNAFELRMYDPVIGRWLGPDPMRQYYSSYMAMGNNPISGVDPTGGGLILPIEMVN